MNKQFSIIYNGQDVAVTCLGNRTYYVQITYKPLRIACKHENGIARWIDLETNVESNLSQHIGRLITEHSASAVEA
jgi:hypothetical protein